MINCKVSRRGGLVYRLHVEGHANSALYGQDLVCNAVSMITQNVFVGVGHVLEVEPPVFEIDPVIGSSTLELTQDQAKLAYVLTETFAEMISLAAEQYEKYIKVEVWHEESQEEV